MQRNFRKDLERIWCKETSFGNGETGKSTGQCYVTALLVYEIFGGNVMHGWIKWNGKRLHHFWNRTFISGRDENVDYTSDQYGGDGFYPIIEGEVFKTPNMKNPRFLKLKAKYLALYQQA
jgi:hypothetical protein